MKSAMLAALAAALMIGCGGDKPEPVAERAAAANADTPSSEPGEKGAGNISFHYANKSTNANLAIDLGSTDLYLEMSGKAVDPAEVAGNPDAPKPKADAEDKHPARAKRPEPQEDQQDQDQAPQNPSGMKGRPGMPQKPEAKPEPQLPEDDQNAGNEDVTSKVLAGIRKAQELFYQKHYPEALQAVRSSLDARPTAEGHALAGSIHFMMGETGMARRQWLEALRLNPDMPAVVNMLEKTRTPGGRGSPSPRPIVSHPAPKAAPASVINAAMPEGEQAPFPEEMNSSDAGQPAAKPAPAASPAPAPKAASRPGAPAEPEGVPPAESAAPAAAPEPSAGDDSGSDEGAPATATAAAPATATSSKPAAATAAKADAAKPAPAAKADASKPAPADKKGKIPLPSSKDAKAKGDKAP